MCIICNCTLHTPPVFGKRRTEKKKKVKRMGMNRRNRKKKAKVGKKGKKPFFFCVYEMPTVCIVYKYIHTYICNYICRLLK